MFKFIVNAPPLVIGKFLLFLGGHHFNSLQFVFIYLKAPSIDRQRETDFYTPEAKKQNRFRLVKGEMNGKPPLTNRPVLR